MTPLFFCLPFFPDVCQHNVPLFTSFSLVRPYSCHQISSCSLSSSFLLKFSGLAPTPPPPPQHPPPPPFFFPFPPIFFLIRSRAREDTVHCHFPCCSTTDVESDSFFCLVTLFPPFMSRSPFVARLLFLFSYIKETRFLPFSFAPSNFFPAWTRAWFTPT